MNNFLKFIEEDIEAKKTLILTLPTNNKTNIKKYNEKIEEILLKYSKYKDAIQKYIYEKEKRFNVKSVNKDVNNLNKIVENLEHIRFILNPLNTYFEKMGFDNLIYQISNYSDFQFDSLNEIINNFLDKFETAGIKLTSKDFNYTCFVNEYMNEFLEVRNNNKKSYGDVAAKFEEIYWFNPELIQHIELNFRKLIKNKEKYFKKYILKIQNEIKIRNGIKNYEDCFNKLKVAYINLNEAIEEDINEVISSAKRGSIDINQYMPDNKIRSENYSSLSIDTLNFDNKETMTNFYKNIEKMKNNIEEYKNYRQFIPLVIEFQKDYKPFLSSPDKSYKNSLVLKEKEIVSLEKKLGKINKKIFNFKRQKDFLKQMKQESVNFANKLYVLYNEKDDLYFKSKTLPLLNESYTITDLLYLYYSYDQLKKIAIKKVFKLNNYDELMNLSDSFDLFAMNPTNAIMEGVLVFGDSNVAKIIANKYRLSNINLTEDDLNTDDLDPLLNKIKFILRINLIENSSTSVEKIWFMAKVAIIKSLEEKINN